MKFGLGNKGGPTSGYLSPPPARMTAVMKRNGLANYVEMRPPDRSVFVTGDRGFNDFWMKTGPLSYIEQRSLKMVEVSPTAARRTLALPS